MYGFSNLYIHRNICKHVQYGQINASRQVCSIYTSTYKNLCVWYCMFDWSDLDLWLVIPCSTTPKSSNPWWNTRSVLSQGHSAGPKSLAKPRTLNRNHPQPMIFRVRVPYYLSCIGTQYARIVWRCLKGASKSMGDPGQFGVKTWSSVHLSYPLSSSDGQ